MSILNIFGRDYTESELVEKVRQAKIHVQLIKNEMDKLDYETHNNTIKKLRDKLANAENKLDKWKMRLSECKSKQL